MHFFSPNIHHGDFNFQPLLGFSLSLASFRFLNLSRFIFSRAPVANHLQCCIIFNLSRGLAVELPRGHCCWAFRCAVISCEKIQFLSLQNELCTKHEPARAARVPKLTDGDDPAWKAVPQDRLHCHPLAAIIHLVDRSPVDFSVLGPLWKNIKSPFGCLTVTMQSLYILPASPLDSIFTEEQQETEIRARQSKSRKKSELQ